MRYLIYFMLIMGCTGCVSKKVIETCTQKGGVYVKDVCIDRRAVIGTPSY